MPDKRYFEGMSELEELAKGVLAIPVAENERDEADGLTRRTLEKIKLGNSRRKSGSRAE